MLFVKRFDWLSTPTGESIVAIGLVATSFSLFAFMFDDIWILFTGDLPRLSLLGCPPIRGPRRRLCLKKAARGLNAA